MEVHVDSDLPQVPAVHAQIREDRGERLRGAPNLIRAYNHVNFLRHIHTRHKRTDRMWANRISVHTEQRDSDERPVPSQPQDSIAQLQGGMMLLCVSLVEVDVCTLSSALHEK